MRFLRDLISKYRAKPEQYEQEEPAPKPDVLKRVPDIGKTTEPGESDEYVIVTSSSPLLEANSKAIDNIIAEVYPKVTRR